MSAHFAPEAGDPPPTLRERLLAAMDRAEATCQRLNGPDAPASLDALVDAIMPIVRAGADDTLPAPGSWATPGQLVARIVDATAPDRLDLADRALRNTQDAMRCFQADHERAVVELTRARQRLAVAQAALANVVTVTEGAHGHSAAAQIARTAMERLTHP